MKPWADAQHHRSEACWYIPIVPILRVEAGGAEGKAIFSYIAEQIKASWRLRLKRQKLRNN